MNPIRLKTNLPTNNFAQLEKVIAFKTVTSDLQGEKKKAIILKMILLVKIGKTTQKHYVSHIVS